jgi:hypothetical protein
LAAFLLSRRSLLFPDFTPLDTEVLSRTRKRERRPWSPLPISPKISHSKSSVAVASAGSPSPSEKLTVGMPLRRNQLRQIEAMLPRQIFTFPHCYRAEQSSSTPCPPRSRRAGGLPPGASAVAQPAGFATPPNHRRVALEEADEQQLATPPSRCRAAVDTERSRFRVHLWFLILSAVSLSFNHNFLLLCASLILILSGVCLSFLRAPHPHEVSPSSSWTASCV